MAGLKSEGGLGEAPTTPRDYAQAPGLTPDRDCAWGGILMVQGSDLRQVVSERELVPAAVDEEGDGAARRVAAADKFRGPQVTGGWQG